MDWEPFIIPLSPLWAKYGRLNQIMYLMGSHQKSDQFYMKDQFEKEKQDNSNYCMENQNSKTQFYINL